MKPKISGLTESRFRAISSRGVNCVACGEVFSNLCAAKKEHAQCQVYSCRNFTAVDTKMRHGVCSYCATDLFGDSRGILPHLHQSHKFRGCKQLLFFSKEKFHKHLRHVHDVPESKVQAMGSVCSASFNTHFAPIFSDPIKLTCNGMDGRHVGVERDDCECEHSANDDTKTSEQF
jgi:hypothetical protein